ncbi:hypothetical protein EMIHUDRAFT_124902, partial [Emiliania huxleyi CCMP1516]|uniref:Uncharacterized protein n=2 Tax=Emiliania huxleyi TaxID=2903 RepID=A0A0D3ICZ0_EMIH1
AALATAALAKALASIDSLVTHTSPAAVLHDAPQLTSALRSVIASKQWGNEELFAAKIAEACTIAMPADPTKFNPDNIRVAKILGSSVLGTTVVRGMCLPRSALGTIK